MLHHRGRMLGGFGGLLHSEKHCREQEQMCNLYDVRSYFIVYVRDGLEEGLADGV